MADFPVDLRHVIVNPTFVHPEEHVGIKVVVVLRAVGLTSRYVASRLRVVVNAEGRHAELHPGLHGPQTVVKLGDKAVDILAAPFCAVCHAIAEAGIRGVVGDGPSRRVGIEIVVDVQAVDIITAYNVRCHTADVSAVFLQGGVHNEQAVVTKAALGMAHGVMRVGQERCALRLGAERINPGVDFHAALVALLHHPGQRVPTLFGSLSLLSGQETRPRLVAAFVERVGLTAHLKHDDVHAAALHHVELVDKVALHLLTAHALKLAVDDLNPSTAKFAFGHRGVLGIDGQKRQTEQC